MILLEQIFAEKNDVRLQTDHHEISFFLLLLKLLS